MPSTSQAGVTADPALLTKAQTVPKAIIAKDMRYASIVSMLSRPKVRVSPRNAPYTLPKLSSGVRLYNRNNVVQDKPKAPILHEIRRAPPLRRSRCCARKLIEIAGTIEPVQNGRIYIELVNAPFLKAGGSGDEFRAASIVRSPKAGLSGTRAGLM